MIRQNHPRRTFFLLLTLLVFSAPSFVGKEKKPKESFKVSGYVGTSSTAAASGINVVLIDKATGTPVDSASTNFMGRYKFSDVRPGTYIIKAEKVTREVTVVQKDIRLDIDLSAAGGVMDYRKGAVEQSKASAPPAGPSDPSLMKAMAGEYYSFSGSTERKLMLCPSGTFFDSRESSYSGSFGTDAGGWGAASGSAGSGKYAIQGNQQSGSMTFSYKNGKKAQVRYQAAGERGCYKFDGITFCYSGAARCQ
ncbi:MAG TPA: carboxypeptidase-like regulatory domain-containing protein [Terriglobia bacterium]|nr:carboxypeptidase-like regulatory domain-containing protein [Terriglobia bacterium]